MALYFTVDSEIRNDEICKYLLVPYRLPLQSSMDSQDRYYCLLHSALHEDSLYRALLSDHEPLLETEGSGHRLNTPICFKMQWQYYRSDPRTKRKIINDLNPNRKREIGAWIAITIYGTLSAVSWLYPMAWYFYVWIYLNAVEGTGIIVGGTAVTAKNVFYWIIVGCYSSLLLLFILIGSCSLCYNWSESIAMMKASVFAWSSRKYINKITVSGAEQLFRQMPTVGTVLESEFIDSLVSKFHRKF